MKVLVEFQDDEDFLEIHLTKKEIQGLLDDEYVSKDTENKFVKHRNLNICVRREVCR